MDAPRKCRCETPFGRDFFDALEEVGDYGEVTVRIRNGARSLLRVTRDQLIVDERAQMPLRVVRGDE